LDGNPFVKITVDDFRGYHYKLNKKQINNKNILSLLIYSRISIQKRLCLPDICTGSILFNRIPVPAKNPANHFEPNF
jgi:hypothetical protein